MARLIQGIAAKHKLTRQPFVVQIMNGGGGGQGFMDVKESPGDPHKVMIVLANAHTVPMSTKLPFNWRDVTPVALMALTLWVAWRAVNVPTFAEFLIATEAEMNKVSWSTRRQLAQDTVVVLLTTLILTLFLLVVDLFWGWLLSRNTVGVLPSRSTAAHKGQEVQEQKW